MARGWDDNDSTALGTHELDWPDGQLFALEVVEGASKGLKWSSSGAGCTIGSHPSNDFVVDDPKVSRFHAEVEVKPEGVWVRDAGSKNGMWVDGVRTTHALLRDGSLLKVGDTAVRCRYATDRAPLPLSTARHFGGLRGASVPMRRAFYILEAAARSEATVLIEGETGTGKDLAAEAIHLGSARAKGTFFVVDCGAIPNNLMESELFGHERGAFTGATTQRRGAFESASGGTIFLDEIGELPIDLQPKLLRVLEQREVQRVGGTQRIAVDTRVIAATNRDLKQQVNEGAFRADLYFRLAVISVRMPALRERPEDVPVIAQHILEGMGVPDETVASLLTPDFARSLRRNAWPGNARELRNYLEQCIVLERAVALARSAPVVMQTHSFEPGMSYAAHRRGYLDAFEKRYLEWLLAAHKGNLASAAKEADINRVHLYKLRKKHGL